MFGLDGLADALVSVGIKIAVVAAFLGFLFAGLAVLGPLPPEVIAFLVSIVKFVKSLDALLPVHEQMTFFAWAAKGCAALVVVAVVRALVLVPMTGSK